MGNKVQIQYMENTLKIYKFFLNENVCQTSSLVLMKIFITKFTFKNSTIFDLVSSIYIHIQRGCASELIINMMTVTS